MQPNLLHKSKRENSREPAKESESTGIGHVVRGPATPVGAAAVLRAHILRARRTRPMTTTHNATSGFSHYLPDRSLGDQLPPGDGRRGRAIEPERQRGVSSIHQRSTRVLRRPPSLSHTRRPTTPPTNPNPKNKTLTSTIGLASAAASSLLLHYFFPPRWEDRIRKGGVGRTRGAARRPVKVARLAETVMPDMV